MVKCLERLRTQHTVAPDQRTLRDNNTQTSPSTANKGHGIPCILLGGIGVTYALFSERMTDHREVQAAFLDDGSG
jgi:hypothetical protein